MSYLISGIQQMGIGIPDAEQAFKHYNRLFGMDVPVFRSGGVADLMKPYTGGRGWNRFAILAVNMQGGGGMEIWQHTERTLFGSCFYSTVATWEYFLPKSNAAILALTTNPKLPKTGIF